MATAKPIISAATADVIATTIENSLTHTRVIALAIKGADFDGSEEIAQLLFRGVEDNLYDLIRDLRGEANAPGKIELIEAVGVDNG